jgi:hypothetical protein
VRYPKPSFDSGRKFGRFVRMLRYHQLPTPTPRCCHATTSVAPGCGGGLENPLGSIDGELLPVHLCGLVAGVEEADVAVELGECPQVLDELRIRGLSWAKRRQAEHQGGDRHDDSKMPPLHSFFLRRPI